MRDRECGEGDSLLSGPLNETQLTSLGFGGEGSEEREEGGDSGLGNDRTESDHGLDGYRFSRTESDLDGCRLNADCKSMDEDSNQNSAPCSYYKFNNYKRPCSPIRKYSDPPDDGFCESHFPTTHRRTLPQLLDLIVRCQGEIILQKKTFEYFCLKRLTLMSLDRRISNFLVRKKCLYNTSPIL